MVRSLLRGGVDKLLTSFFLPPLYRGGGEVFNVVMELIELLVVVPDDAEIFIDG